MRPARRIHAITLGLAAGLLPARAAAQPAEVPPPQSQPAHVTVADELRRWSGARPANLPRAELARLAAIEFAAAVAAADGRRAEAVTDAIGYQALPFEGRLPETPARPRSPQELGEGVDRRRGCDIGGLPAGCFDVLSTEELGRRFPAVKDWILPPQDVVIRVVPVDGVEPRWLARPACIVVRLRGARATVVGGNLLAALHER